MEERIRLLEGKLELMMNTVVKLDQAVGVLMQWVLANKGFMDTLQVAKPANPNEVIKPEGPIVDPGK